jgi:hypothetical protein
MFDDGCKLEEKSKSFKDILSKFKMNNFERFIMIVLIIMIILFIISLIYSINIIKINNKNFQDEKIYWYRSHYYISNSISESVMLTTAQRKSAFQLKIAGFLKELNINWSNKEIVNWTSYVFDMSELYGLDPYIPVSIVFHESRFNRKAIGTKHDSGIFQFLPSTAKLISKSTGIDYYAGIEFDIMASSKLFFSYIKILSDTFCGNINCVLLSYNLGDRNVIYYSDAVYNEKLNYYEVSNDGIEKVRKVFYVNKNIESYDEKILKTCEYLKYLGISKELK